MTKNLSIVENPIFLVGAERSGTTILRLMLSHHPQIAFHYEFEFVVDKISNDGDFPDLKEYHEWLLTVRGFDYQIDPNLEYVELVNSFLVQFRSRQRKPLVGATIHRHFDGLLKIWPDARFIHIVRDGRDVARSCIGMGWAGNIWTAVERWITVENLWAEFKELIPRERWIEIKYEELISNPVKNLTDICDFIGVSYDSAMLSYSQTSTYSAPDPKLIQQWPQKLSEREIRLVESRISNMLEERGYELSGLPLLKAGYLTFTFLKLQDWYARLQFRIKRYGFSLVVADYLSRHLHLNSWQKQLKQLIDEIDIAHLK